MISLRIWLFKIFQYFEIFFGFTYAYVDFKKREVKFYLCIKIYFYLFNFYSIYQSILNFKLYYISEILNLGSYIKFPTAASPICIFLGRMILCIKEEQFYKKVIVKNYLPLQRIYFEQLENLNAEKSVQLELIVQMFAIFIFNIYKCVEGSVFLIRGYWKPAVHFYAQALLAIQPHCILWYHGFILCYINYVLKNLNKQLQNRQIYESFAKIYIKTLLLLHQVNNMYSPIIFVVLIQLLMKHATCVYGLYCFTFGDSYFNLALLEIGGQFMEYISIYMYYLICEKLSNTIKNLGQIMLENIIWKENQEV